MKHQVAAIEVLHHKKQMTLKMLIYTHTHMGVQDTYLSLECRMEMCEEWVISPKG